MKESKLCLFPTNPHSLTPITSCTVFCLLVFWFQLGHVSSRAFVSQDKHWREAEINAALTQTWWFPASVVNNHPHPLALHGSIFLLMHIFVVIDHQPYGKIGLWASISLTACSCSYNNYTWLWHWASRPRCIWVAEWPLQMTSSTNEGFSGKHQLQMRGFHRFRLNYCWWWLVGRDEGEKDVLYTCILWRLH